MKVCKAEGEGMCERVWRRTAAASISYQTVIVAGFGEGDIVMATVLHKMGLPGLPV